jgi:hypothetical protein
MTGKKSNGKSIKTTFSCPLGRKESGNTIENREKQAMNK